MARKYTNEQRSATIVVSAVDSLSQQADYHCDGIRDLAISLEAINALPDGGGELVFLEGTYAFGDQLLRAIDNVTIRGQGKATFLGLDSSTPVISAGSQSGWLIINLATDAGGIDIASASLSAVVNCWENDGPVTKLPGVLSLLGSRANHGLDAGYHFWDRYGSGVLTDDDAMVGHERIAALFTQIVKAHDSTVGVTGIDAASELRSEAWDGGASQMYIYKLLWHITALNAATLDWEVPFGTSRMTLTSAGQLTLGNCKLSLGAGPEKTIASGVITITHSFHSIDTESDDPTDDLDTISGGAIGDLLVLRAIHAARTVVVKDDGANIFLKGAIDCVLDHYTDTLVLFQIDTDVWVEVSRSSNMITSGDVVSITKVIDHADLTDDGGATGRVDFDDAIPAGSIIKAVKCDFTELFNSDNTTTLTMMIGYVGDLDAFNLTADPGEAAFNHTTDVYWGESDCQAHRVTTAKTPRVTFTEDDDITHVIGGAGAQGGVTITITYMKA